MRSNVFSVVCWVSKHIWGRERSERDEEEADLVILGRGLCDN